MPDENKNIPNPGGRLGGEKHRSKVQQIIDKIMNRHQEPDPEHCVKLSDDKSKYVDVAVLDQYGNPIEYHQIGKQNKGGSPVARERRAIDEIEKATGKKVWFHAYNVVIAVILLVGLVLAVSAA